jgi:hypothetical protein
MTRSELYSNESDRESDYDSDSLSDALSPVDGYFSTTQRPRQMFTTPSSSSASESKAAEDARERSQASTTSASNYTYASTDGHDDDHDADDHEADDAAPRGPSTSSSRSTEPEPLLDRYDPPPAYSAAISTPYMPQAGRETEPLNTMGRPTPYGAIDPERGPQSMADGPSSPSDSDSLLYASPKHRRRLFTRRGVIKTLLAIFAVLLLAAIMLKMTYYSDSVCSSLASSQSSSPSLPPSFY